MATPMVTFPAAGLGCGSVASRASRPNTHCQELITSVQQPCVLRTQNDAQAAFWSFFLTIAQQYLPFLHNFNYIMVDRRTSTQTEPLSHVDNIAPT